MPHPALSRFRGGKNDLSNSVVHLRLSFVNLTSASENLKQKFTSVIPVASPDLALVIA